MVVGASFCVVAQCGHEKPGAGRSGEGHRPPRPIARAVGGAASWNGRDRARSFPAGGTATTGMGGEVGAHRAMPAGLPWHQ